MPYVAAALLASGLANIYANKQANKTNWARQQQMNERNYQAQKEFAQNSIQWRKQDALRAGINPIYALNANGANFSPSFQATGSNPNDYSFLGQSAVQAVSAYQQTQQAKADKASVALIKQQTATEQARELESTARASLMISQADQIANANAPKAPQKLNVSATSIQSTQNLANEMKKVFSSYDIQTIGTGRISVTENKSRTAQQSSDSEIMSHINELDTHKNRKQAIREQLDFLGRKTGYVWKEIDAGLSTYDFIKTNERYRTPAQKKADFEKAMKESDRLYKEHINKYGRYD